MKMNKYLAMAAIAAMFAFASCGEDEPEVITPADPTVAITEGTSLAIPVTTTTATPYSLTLNATFTVPGKIKTLVFNRNAYKGDVKKANYSITETITTENGKTAATIAKTDEIALGNFHLDSIDKISYEFIVTDVNDNIGEATYDVTVTGYTALATEKLGKIWKLHSDGKACWNLKGDVEVTAVGETDAVKATRYLINSDKVNSVNIETNFTGSWTSGSVAWTSTGGTSYTTTGNGTKFVKVVGFDYANAKKEKANYLFNKEVDNQKSAIDNPVIGDIYIAKYVVTGTTPVDEIYVIKVTKNDKTVVVPTTKANTGVLEFSYKK